MVLVQCNECGNRQETFGKIFFTCKKCKANNLIENSKVEPQEIIRELEAEEKKENPQTEIKPQEPQEQTEIKPQEPQEQILTIEETQEQEEKKETQEEEFFCPICNSKVNKFEDCANCGHELVWSDE